MIEVLALYQEIRVVQDSYNFLIESYMDLYKEIEEIIKIMKIPKARRKNISDTSTETMTLGLVHKQFTTEKACVHLLFECGFIDRTIDSTQYIC